MVKYGIISIAVVILILGCLYVTRTTHTQSPQIKIQYLLDKENKPTAALRDLLTVLNVSYDGTLPSLVDATQKTWLRKPGTERWEVEEKYKDLQNILWPLFIKLGVILEEKPLHTHYTYVFLLGATVHGVRARLAYLLELWNQGVRFDTLVILAGQRPLDATLENEQALRTSQEQTLPWNDAWNATVLPLTEIDMMRMVLEQTTLPEEFKHLPILWIDVPMKQLPDGKVARPTTGDTIIAFLATNPATGNCLAISCQPHVTYQDTVLRTYLPTTYTLETVGRKTSEDENISVILDAMARSLYQEKVLLEKAN